MVDKHRLPRIQCHTDINNPHASRNISNVDFEIQRLRLNSKTCKEKRNRRWGSSNFVQYNVQRSDSKKHHDGRKKRSESLIRPDEALDKQGQEGRLGNACLRRYNSEPFLQQTCSEFSVHATPVKLNNRSKDESKKILYNFLPPVFFDPQLSEDNLMDLKQTKMNSIKSMKKVIKNSEANQKMLAKNTHVDESKGSKDAHKIRRRKESKPKTDKFCGENFDVNRKTVKPKGLLPKRRLSEQIDSYEVNRATNDKAFPRKITIRTSKSCPTIVIHECGDNDDTSGIWKSTKNDTNIRSEETNLGEKELTVQRSRTTSLVACWKPNQSFVTEK